MIERIQVAPDVTLAVDVAPPCDMPALVFSNSIGANFHMWDEVASLLAGKVRIIRYDTRGHGLSDIGSEPITIETLGQDVIAILDRLGISRAFLCGLSLGGLTAQWLGANCPERLYGLLLANTAANFPPAQMWHDRAKAVREQGMAPLVAPTLERWFTQPFRHRKPDRVAEVSKMIAATSTEGYARCCEVLAQTDMSKTISSIQLLVRVICGAHDPSTTPARAQELVDLIPNADLITLEAAHVSSIEAPREFAQAALDFIERATHRRAPLPPRNAPV